MNFVRGDAGPRVEVVTETVNWDFKPPGERVRSLPVNCLVNQIEGNDPENPPALFFGGYGEREWANKLVVRHCGRLGVSAVGVVMPFDLLPADKLAVEAACVEVPRIVADYYRHGKESGLPAIAESQGAGVVLRAAKDEPGSFTDLGLVAPVCVHLEKGSALTEEERRRQFYRRFGANALRQPLADPINVASIFTIGSQLVFDVRTGRFPKKVGLAMTTPLNETVLEHGAKGHKVVIVSGAKDRVFPLMEIKRAFESYRTPGATLPEWVIVPKTSHVASASRKGRLVLETVVKHLELTSPAQTPKGDEELPPAEYPM